MVNLRTGEEYRIWFSTFSAAFVQEVSDAEKLWVGNADYPFDKALKATSAERAGFIANHAVKEYRRWNDLEGGWPDIEEE